MTTDKYTDVYYELINQSKPPFDNVTARKALALSLDADAVNEVRNLGLFTMASGPFAPGAVGYLEDAGMPDLRPRRGEEDRDPVRAGDRAAARRSRWPPPTTPRPRDVQYLQQLAEKAGMKVRRSDIEQASLIDTALGGDFQVTSTWRNHPGGDPDEQYIWWHSEAPTNFNRIKDPEVDRLLDAGRVEVDPAKRKTIYEDLNRRFAEQVDNVWLSWVDWNIVSNPNVFGVYGPDNPDGSKPFPGLANGHPVAGLWVAKS